MLLLLMLSALVKTRLNSITRRGNNKPLLFGQKVPVIDNRVCLPHVPLRARVGRYADTVVVWSLPFVKTTTTNINTPTPSTCAYPHASLVKTRLKTIPLFYFNLDWNVNIANSAERTMREHTISNLLSSTTTPSACWASLMLNCCILRVYGRISCCISVISSPLQVYRRRAADVNPSLIVQWSKSCSKKGWNFDIKRVDQGKINTEKITIRTKG